MTTILHLLILLHLHSNQELRSPNKILPYGRILCFSKAVSLYISKNYGRYNVMIFRLFVSD